MISRREKQAGRAGGRPFRADEMAAGRCRHALLVSTGISAPIIVLLAILILAFAPDSRGAQPPDPWHDDSRPVASFLFTDEALLQRLADDLGLSDSQVAAVRAASREEAEALAELRRESEEIVKRNDMDVDQKRAAVADMGYNLRVRAIISDSRTRIEATMDDSRRAALPGWVSARFQEQRSQFAEAAVAAATGGAAAGGGGYRVYATQYYSNYGRDSVDVAVPDKYVKFASLGWEYNPGYPQGADYTVDLSYEGNRLNGVQVKDCGPWNIDDNYWNSGAGARPRRLFGGLSMGLPEAQAAYFDGYNDGLDQFGRTVTNPAGIDLSPEAGVRLGLGYLVSGWVTVNFNWEGFPVYGGIAAKYEQLGGAPGEPLNAEYDVPGGRAQDFTNGRLIYNAASGQVFWVYGAILARYDQLGSSGGFLGHPLSDETDVPGGRATNFQGGRIYWSEAYGAKVVYGAILTKHDAVGGAAVTGLPVDEEQAAGGGRGCVFEYSSIYWSPETGAKQVYGAVRHKYAEMGGPDRIGLPTTDEYDVSGGRANDFQVGRIYWSPDTDAHHVLGGILAKYEQVGGPQSLGLPETDEVPAAGEPDARMNDFSRGQVYWKPQQGATAVYGGILARYESLGGAAALGVPVTDEQDVPGIPGARVSNFSGGRIYWSPWTGAHEVYGGILGKYLELGGPNRLGLPLTGEYDVTGGRAEEFETGRIYWTPASGSHLVVGAIKAKYDSLGGIDYLGPPVSDEMAVDGVAGARVSLFSGGRIYWDATHDSHVVYGAILAKYLSGGGAAALGMPVSDELPADGSQEARMGVFSGGRIYWSPSTGANMVYGAILARYLQAGGARSRLGLATSDEFAIPGGRRSNFQGGYITWHPASGAQLVTG